MVKSIVNNIETFDLTRNKLKALIMNKPTNDSGTYDAKYRRVGGWETLRTNLLLLTPYSRVCPPHQALLQTSALHSMPQHI